MNGSPGQSEDYITVKIDRNTATRPQLRDLSLKPPINMLPILLSNAATVVLLSVTPVCVFLSVCLSV